MFDEDRRRIDQLGRSSSSAMRLFQALRRKRMLTIPTASDRLSLSRPAVTAAFANLESIGITREVSGRQRGKIYVYDRYLSELAKGTEPIRR